MSKNTPIQPSTPNMQEIAEIHALLTLALNAYLRQKGGHVSYTNIVSAIAQVLMQPIENCTIGIVEEHPEMAHANLCAILRWIDTVREHVEGFDIPLPPNVRTH